jgi:mannan endo-1,4-beta-mannosidase
MQASRIALVALTLALAVPATAQTPYRSLNYLYSIRGARTVAGQHNREPNSSPAQWTAQIHATTGRYPGLWSGDFLFQADNIANRGRMIDQAIQEWRNGAIVNIMWHACSPALAEPCGWDSGGVLSEMSNEQWSQLITNGTGLNTTWKRRMDAVAVHLQRLEDAGVEVLFRPLHEMNQGVFWWAGRPGPNGTARLFQITRDYLRNTKGLTNLIWVWDLQDFGSLSSDISAYHPGSSNFDVFALDVYEGLTQTKYNLSMQAAGGKPFAIGECATLPTLAQLDQQPQWAFFMGWAELVFSSNSTSTIQSVYGGSRVVTLDEMPGWGGTTPSPTAVPTARPTATPSGSGTLLSQGRPAFASSSESASHAQGLAFDGNTATRWSSAWADPQWIMVDLGASYPLSRVTLQWEAAFARAYQIQLSNDNVGWSTVYETYAGDGGTDDIALSGSARYVKMYAWTRATAYGYSLWELRVYGGGAPRPTASPTAGARATATARPRATPTSGGTPAWTTGTSYAPGARVTYAGIAYECLQAHTSQAGWEPPNVPALWKRL